MELIHPALPTTEVRVALRFGPLIARITDLSSKAYILKVLADFPFFHVAGVVRSYFDGFSQGT